MVTKSEIEALLRSALRGRTDVRLAILFGSWARGMAREDSDVDLAVEAPGVDLLGLAADLSLALKREVHLVLLAEAGYPLLGVLLREGIVVHEAAPSTSATWRARAILAWETDRPYFERMRDGFLRRIAERGLSRG